MDANMMKKAMQSAQAGKSMEKKGYMDIDNDDMQARNNMKQALSQVVKILTPYITNDESSPDQDGNMGETVGGTQDYSGLDYDSKKKMLISKMSKMG